MLKKAKKLNRSFEDYESMQDRHIKSFSTELRPDLSTQNFEREKYFENLKNDLTNMLYVINNERGDESIGIASDCRQRIESILDHDKLLMERLIAYKKQLSMHLKKMGRGKKAIHGYLKNSKTNEAPRFMDKSG